MINGIIYKTINLVNNKVYIGKAEQENCNKKSYFGSGIYLKRAIEKYSKDKFIRKTIDAANTTKELNEKRKILDKIL